jgi:hypothetical protein
MRVFHQPDLNIFVLTGDHPGHDKLLGVDAA